MFLLHGRSEYVDVLERALYNGMLAGVSMGGDRFFYVNPLASRGQHHREPWFGCACCPPNVMRLIPQVGGLLYAGGDGAVYVNLYASSNARIAVGETPVEIAQHTDYPRSGEVKLTVEPAEAAAFDLKLRIPDWCQHASVKVDGEELPATPGEDGYVCLSRTWQPGDVVTLKLDMPIRRIAANPKVTADVGRVALMRGPLVYCLEAADNEGAVRDIALPRRAELKTEWQPDLLGGVILLRGKGLRRARDESAELYRAVDDDPKADVTAIPYYAWDHREPGEMVVWVPEITALAETAGTTDG
jgi:DUF1680 family protein